MGLSTHSASLCFKRNGYRSFELANGIDSRCVGVRCIRNSRGNWQRISGEGLPLAPRYIAALRLSAKRSASERQYTAFFLVSQKLRAKVSFGSVSFSSTTMSRRLDSFFWCE